MTKWRRADNVADIEHSEQVDAGEILCFGEKLLVELEFGGMITADRFDTKQGKLVLCKERPGGVDSEGPLLCDEVAGDVVGLECRLYDAVVVIEWGAQRVLGRVDDLYVHPEQIAKRKEKEQETARFVGELPLDAEPEYSCKE